MRFFNRNVISFAAVVTAASLFFFLVLHFLLTNRLYMGIFFLVPVYMLILFFGGLYFGRRDTSRAFGFNYHLVTYLCCITVPMILYRLGFLPVHFFYDAISTMLFWGIGLMMHFVMFLFLWRKIKLI